MKAPDFSVIIPTYNRVEFLTVAVHSVLRQTHQDFEIIIVDDGSTDNTAQIISTLQDNRIKYFKKANGERAAARNYGVCKSAGAYVTFLDSDDLLKENHLEEAAKFLSHNPDVAVFHLGYDVVRNDGTIIYPWKVLPDPANYKLMEGNSLSCMGVFVRRDVAGDNRFNEDRDLTGSEDYELWVRLAARYPIRTSPVSTACLVNHDERSVLQVNPEKLSKRISLMRYYLSKDKKVMLTFGPQLKTLFGFHYLYEALHQALGAQRVASVKALVKAVVQHPAIVVNYRFLVVLKKLIWR